MTLTTDQSTRPTPTGRMMSHPRAVGVSALVLVLVAAVAAPILVLRHLDHRYGPVDFGGYFGYASYRNVEFGADNSARITSQPGATAQMITLLRNDGSHSVQVTAVSGADYVVGVEWSVYRWHNGGPAAGDPTPWHDFPATIAGNGTIRLRTTVRRPLTCPRDTPGTGGEYFDGTASVAWQSLLAPHRTTVPGFAPTAGSLGLRVC